MSKLIEICTHRSFKWTILLTLIYFGIGFAFLHFELADYGWIFFVLLPFSLGIAVGKMEKQKWAYLGLVVGLIAFLSVLIAVGLEGIVCVFMTVPLVIPLVWLGTVANRFLTKKGVLKQRENVNSLVLPLLVTLLGAPIEKNLNEQKVEVIEVKTERIFPYTTDEVYNTIKSVDTLIADKPFLMKLDLPIPNKCILEKEEVGGLRTCYFSGGTITEKITALEKGKVLKMDVIDYTLTGRKWLGFKEAIYYFNQVGTDSCVLTRITTYTSVLKPRIYWEPLEKLGISQEHQYVFDNLDNDLQMKYGGK